MHNEGVPRGNVAQRRRAQRNCCITGNVSQRSSVQGERCSMKICPGRLLLNEIMLKRECCNLQDLCTKTCKGHCSMAENVPLLLLGCLAGGESPEPQWTVS